MGKILNELKEHYDFIIMDSSDTTNSVDALACMKFSNHTFYLVNPKTDEQTVFNKVSKIKTEYHIENILFILNNVKPSKKQKSERSIIRNLETATKTPFLKKVALWFY
jgi:cellulose biosynthesis protein BcsQ